MIYGTCYLAHLQRKCLGSAGRFHEHSFIHLFNTSSKLSFLLNLYHVIEKHSLLNQCLSLQYLFDYLLPSFKTTFMFSKKIACSTFYELAPSNSLCLIVSKYCFAVCTILVRAISNCQRPPPICRQSTAERIPANNKDRILCKVLVWLR
jgi:hypothetical protein